MKIFYLTLSFLFFSSFSPLSYGFINPSPHTWSVEDSKPEFKFEKNLQDEFKINEKDTENAIQDMYKPIISFYIISFLHSIEQDSNVISTQCDTSLETKEKQLKFIQCFNEKKEILFNHIYISSIELSISFIEIDKKEKIKQNFINSFKDELMYVKNTYSKQIYDSIQTIVVDLFSKILLESFQKNLIIANEYNINESEVEQFFSNLATELNNELKNINQIQ